MATGRRHRTFPKRWRVDRRQKRRGNVDEDMLASDDVRNARGPNFRRPLNSVPEGPFPNGQLRRFPRNGMVDLALSRIASLMKEDWFGSDLRLFPLFPWGNWCAGLASFERVIEWSADASFFVERSSGAPKLVPDVGDVEWAVFRNTKRA